MPKKFVGENSKSTVARARKEAVRTEKREKETAAKEDAYWADDDKHAQRKLQRKQEEEKKRQQALEKKQQNKEAYEQELKSISTSNKASSTAGPSNLTTKVTLAQLEAARQAEELRRKAEEERRLEANRKIAVPDEQIPENLNRLALDEEVASNVTEAIKVLDDASGKKALSDAEKHPEKRVKAAFTAFEERRLPELKKEHPTFRLSQLKQLLKKEWLKSAENPLNEKILNIIR